MRSNDSMKEDTGGHERDDESEGLEEPLMRLRYECRQSRGREARSTPLDRWCRIGGHECKHAIKERRRAARPGVAGGSRSGGEAAPVDPGRPE